MSKNNEAQKFGLSDSYWNSLSDKSRALYQHIQPLPHSNHEVNVFLNHLEQNLAMQVRDCESMGGKFELCPDFQRGHVWTETQQIAYVESLLRGAAPRTILFNSAVYGTGKGDLNPYDIVCVDGLQRLTAVRRFMAGGFKVFGEYTAADLEDTPFNVNRNMFSLVFKTYSVASREELLDLYVALNSAGTIHTKEELDRVRKLKGKV